MNIFFVTLGVGILAVAGLGLLFHDQTRLRFEPAKTPLAKADVVSQELWRKLAETKIFFGHQSVGYNIVSGIEDVISGGDKVKLNIVETSSTADFDGPVFAHSQAGRNKQPISKIESFTEIMNSGVGKKVDVAILKFCYIDITKDSNPGEIFEKYKTMISDLERRYPSVRFLHMTVPLKSPSKGAQKAIKSFAKWLLGMPTEIDDNIRRQEYNAMIREEYGETGNVFDIAMVESTAPDGLVCYVERKGRKIPFMFPGHTDDGGHLNRLGRRFVAEQMLITLAK